MNENKWYALYTRVNQEKKVSEQLRKRQLEYYCPLNKIQKQWADRKKTIFEPVFKSYVFVRTSPPDFHLFKQVDGVVNFVYWLGKPAVVHDSEIDAIRDFLAEHNNISLEKTDVKVNDTVKIINGPFLDKEGKVTFIKGKTIKILLPSLGFIMSAELDTTRISLIPEKTNRQTSGSKPMQETNPSTIQGSM